MSFTLLKSPPVTASMTVISCLIPPLCAFEWEQKINNYNKTSQKLHRTVLLILSVSLSQFHYSHTQMILFDL